MDNAFVAVLMGSDNDLPVMKIAIDTLKSFNINVEAKITSAHRTPEITQQYVKDADQRGCVTFIAGAGLAAHLAGAIAANTCKPVIGVPLSAGSLSGLDALLSTVQMPGGIPVACVAVGEAGAKNAAILAAEIIALNNADVAEKLIQYRKEMLDKIETKNAVLQQAISSDEK